MIPNRLSGADVWNLQLEAPDNLMHQAAFGVLDAADLLAPDGRVQIALVRKRLAPKIARIPELRHVLRPTRLFEGRPFWVDDPNFRIDNHVLVAPLRQGGESEALRFLERLMAVQMDRSRPLWELWFLEGYGPDRIGIVAKTHHALVDGVAMINLMAQLFDLEPQPDQLPVPESTPQPPPAALSLVADNMRSRVHGMAQAIIGVRHPLHAAGAASASFASAWETLRQGRRAPRTSLNRPIQAARRFAIVRLELGDVKAVAHAANVKVNDVFLAIVAGALRKVVKARGEDVSVLHASMAVSMHPRGDGAVEGNRAGVMIVSLPVGEADVQSRLAVVATATVRAKSLQRARFAPVFMSMLAHSGLTRAYIRRQRMINLLTTNLPGPQFPLYVAGARLLQVYAVPPIAGNVTLSVAAISYDGQFDISLVADKAAWPDFELLTDATRASWSELAASTLQVPVVAGL